MSIFYEIEFAKLIIRHLTYKQACERYNLGMNTVQKLARQGDALVKIGKSARVDVEKMDKFVLSFRE